jgi:hypothetical protein
MRSLTFTVHFTDDIGPEQANTEIAQELAAAFQALLDGHEPETLGHAFGIEHEGRVVRVTSVDWTGGR